MKAGRARGAERKKAKVSENLGLTCYPTGSGEVKHTSRRGLRPPYGSHVGLSGQPGIDTQLLQAFSTHIGCGGPPAKR